MNTRPIVRFSLINVPTDIQTAETRIEEIGSINVKIESAIDLNKPTDFESEGTYSAWVRRAQMALRFNTREIRFLEDWIKQQQGELCREEKSDVLQKFTDTSLEIIEYHPLYTEENLPASLKDNERRHEELVDLKRHLEEMAREIKALSFEIQAPKDVFHIHHNRAMKTLKPIEKELRILKMQRRELTPTKPAPDTDLFKGTSEMVLFLYDILSDLEEKGLWSATDTQEPKIEAVRHYWMRHQ